MSLVDLVGINTCWVHRSARIPDTSRQDGISLLVSGFSRTWSKKGSKLTGSTRPADSVGIISHRTSCLIEGYTPPNATPSRRNKALGPLSRVMVVNNHLRRPYFFGGGVAFGAVLIGFH